MAFPSSPFVALPLLALLLALLLGCAVRPAGPPIVLRPPGEQAGLPRPPARPRPNSAAAAAPRTASAGTAGPGAGGPAELSAAEKQALFEKFDAHLKQSGP